MIKVRFDGDSGALDSDLLAQRQFYSTDFTKPLLFLGDGGCYNKSLATNMHLTGDQWGVMNETASYPGQPWLWLDQMRYHVNPFGDSASADVWAIYLAYLAGIAAGESADPVHSGASRHPTADPHAPADLAELGVSRAAGAAGSRLRRPTRRTRPLSRTGQASHVLARNRGPSGPCAARTAPVA